MRSLFACVVLLAPALAAIPPAAHAQQISPPDTIAADTADDGISPRGAFIRSLIIPGWGQASAGSYGRGGVFFAIQSSSYYMYFRTRHRLDQAREIQGREMRIAADSIHTVIDSATTPEACAANPTLCEAANTLRGDQLAFRAAVDSSTNVARMGGLVESREDQLQDWVTYTLFFTLMGGVDAYVNRHLTDMPVGITSSIGRNGRYTIGVRVWTGGWR